MSCVEILGLLPFRSFDCLDVEEAQAIERHLEECTACAREARIRGEVMTILGKPLPDEDRKLPERVWENVSVAVLAGAPATKGETAPGDMSIALVCSFCHDVLRRLDARYCASCLAPHHGDCFRAHGRCSAYGCEETHTVSRELDVELPREKGKAKPKRRVRGLLVALPLLLGGGAVAAFTARHPLRQDAPAETVLTPAFVPAPPPRRVSIQVKDQDLNAVVASIAEQAGVPLIVAPEVHEKVSLGVSSMEWRDALELAAKQGKCVLQPLADGAILIEQPPLVTIQFTDANVRTVLQLIAAYSGMNIMVSPEIRGDVTLDVHATPWNKALETVLHTVGDYRAERRGEIVVLVPRSNRAHWGTVNLSSPPWPTVGAGEAPGKKMDLDVKDASVAQVCQKIAAAAGREIVVPADDGQKITLRASGASWRDLLAVVVRTRPEGKRFLRVVEHGSKLEVEALSRNTLQATDANVRTVLALFANLAKKNVVISPEVRGDVTFDFHDFPYDEALEATAFVVGDYTTILDSEDLVRVVPKSSVAAAFVKPVSETHAAPAQHVVFPTGRMIDLRVDGLFVSPTGHEGRAVIWGRDHEPGDVVTGKDGKPSDVRIVAIRAGEIELEAVLDAGKPRVVLKVGN